MDIRKTLIRFWKDESGIFNLLDLLGPVLSSGLIGGGTGKLAATALGGMITDRQNRKAAAVSHPANRLRATVQAAREMGIHELEALRSGIGGANIQSSPRIATQALMQNSFDQIQAERQSRERAAERDAELKNALEIERIRSGRSRIQSPTLISQTPAPDGTQRPIDVLPEDNMAVNSMTGKDGDTYNVGPDTPGPDELLGWALTTYPQRIARENPEANQQLRNSASDIADNKDRIPPFPFVGRLPHTFVDIIDHVYDTFGDPEFDPKQRDNRNRWRRK